MESIPLEMDDIYDDAGDGDFAGDLPEMPDELQPEAEEAPGGEGTENSAEVLRRLKKLGGAGKKVVKCPQPKLDADRLTGERGLGVVPGLFKNMKFRGKGYEAADLKQVMQKLEHWAHRLFPKMTFDEVLERLERLGSKKPVQTCVKRIRLDIPVLGQEVVEDDDAAAAAIPTQNGVDIDEDPFDMMLREEREKEERNRASSSFFPSSPVPSTSAVFSPQPSTSKAPPAQSVLTPEQRERMERNKRLAMERKAAKACKEAGEQTGSPSLDDSMTLESPWGSQVPSSSRKASPPPKARESSPPPSPATPSSPHSRTQSSGGSEGFHGNTSFVESSCAPGEEGQTPVSSSQEVVDSQNQDDDSHRPATPESSAGPDSTSAQEELPDSQTPDSKHQKPQKEQEAVTQESEAGDAGQELNEKTPVDEMYTEQMEEAMETQAETETEKEMEVEAGTPAESIPAGPKDEDAETQTVPGTEGNNSLTKEDEDTGEAPVSSSQEVVDSRNQDDDSHRPATPESSAGPDSTSAQEELPDSQTPDSKRQKPQKEQEAVTQESEAGDAGQELNEKTPVDEMYTEQMEEAMENQAETETEKEMEVEAGTPAESIPAGPKDEDAETQTVPGTEGNNSLTKEDEDTGEATQETQWPGTEAAVGEEGNVMDVEMNE